MDFNLPNNQLSKLALIAILVAAPIISYLYLKKGIEYRKESLAALQPKDVDIAISNFIRNHIPKNGKASLVRMDNRQQDVTDLLAKIDERITEKDYFQILEFENTVLPSASYDLMLLDTAQVVRATYQMGPELGKQLIRDLSVVIPMAPKKKLQLERDKNK